MSTQSSLKPKHERFHNFVSGLIAGLISVTVCNPLDIARTRLNVLNAPFHHEKSAKYTHFLHAMSTIWKEQGLKGFYSGYRTNVVAVPIFHSLFFPLYESIKKKALQNKYSLSQSSMISTALSGVICNTITNPIWVVRTRLMAQYLHHQSNQYRSNAPLTVIREMYRTEGLQSLYKGLIPSLFSVIGAMAYFSIYENMKLWLKSNTVWHIFLASTFSKIISVFLTYPIVVVRTVMFDFRGKEKSHFKNIFSHIWRQNGIIGFYAGIKPDLIRLIPSNAIIFIVYETLKKYFD